MRKGIAIGCVDPRLHAVLPKVASIMGVDQVYQFRQPGPDGVMLLDEHEDEKKGVVAGVKRLSSLVPIEAIGVVAHTDCAGHSVPDEQHRQDTRTAAQTLKDELEASQPVHAILAVKAGSDKDWVFEHLGEF